MNIKKKLDKIFTEDLLSESRRLRPAKILTVRGIIIEADHTRIVQHPSTGTRILVMGIDRQNTSYVVDVCRPRYKHSLTRIMPDFIRQGEYIPAPTPTELIDTYLDRDRPWQDESGWSHANQRGKYDAHRAYEIKNKFRKILTAFMSNIKSIEWLNQ